MNYRKIGKALLYPHIAIMIALIPIATVLLVCSMVFLGTESIPAILSYVLSAYTLTVWCFKIPYLIDLFKGFKNKNKLALRWKNDIRWRVGVLLCCALAFNTVYGAFQILLGIYHHTFWFTSIGVYYLCLAIMRYFLFAHTKSFEPGERVHTEIIKYRAAGWILLVMSLALTAMVYFMVYWNRTFSHHMITVIAMAAYTFTAFTVAIINVIRYKKYDSPVFSASKAISFAAASVSMLTLTSTMLTTFDDGTMNPAAVRFMVGSVGFTVSAVVVSIAIYMIVNGTKKLKSFSSEVNNGQ